MARALPALALGLLAALPSAAGVAAEQPVPAALSADDECAGAEGEGTCGLNALQHRGQKGGSQALATALAAEVAAADEERAAAEHAAPGQLGVVSEVYTFGAPATSSAPFLDLNRPDRAFRGLRSYTENIFGTQNESHQIDGGALWGTYKHPKMAVAVLHWGRDSFFVPGVGKPDWPMSGGFVYADWGLHHRKNYVDRLLHLTVNGQGSSQRQPFRKALTMAYLAFEAYSDNDDFKKMLQKDVPGTQLVAREVQNTLEAKDAVWLVQNRADLGCSLVFTGTSKFSELSTSLSSHKTSYCKFSNVHAGYRNKLYWITHGVWSKMRPKLSKCSYVSCTGHSLGGALCDIFSACANSKRKGDEDYERQMWVQGKPELMPEI